jgi:hypothetical protein
MLLDTGNSRSWSNAASNYNDPKTTDPLPISAGSFSYPGNVYADVNRNIIVGCSDPSNVNGYISVVSQYSNTSGGIVWTANNYLSVNRAGPIIFGIDPRHLTYTTSSFVFVSSSANSLYYLPGPYNSPTTFTNINFLTNPERGVIYAKSMAAPNQTTLDTTNSFAYVLCSSSFGNYTVAKLDLLLNKTDPWVTLGTVIGNDSIYTMVCDQAGNIYLGYGNGDIAKITPAGVLTQIWASIGTNQYVYALVVDSTGTKMYALCVGNYIHLIDISTATVTLNWLTLTYTSAISDPTIIADQLYIDAYDNLYTLSSAWVNNQYRQLISQITPDGVFKEIYSLVNGDTYVGKLALDNTGIIYGSAQLANSIFQVTPNYLQWNDASNRGNDARFIKTNYISGFFGNTTSSNTFDLAPPPFVYSNGGYFNYTPDVGGTSVAYTNVSNTFGSAFSICSWVYCLDGTYKPTIMSNADNFQGYSFFMTNNYLGFVSTSTGIPETLQSSATTNLTNRWCFVATTINKATNTINLYLNGNLLSVTGTFTNTFPTSTSIQSNTFIGTDNNQFNSDFIGGIAMVGTYSRAITQSEVIQNFIATRSRFGV